MEFRDNTARFAILVSSRPYAFTTMRPYWIEGLSIMDKVKLEDELTDEQKDIVKLCSECDDGVLLKKFSKGEATLMNLFAKFDANPQLCKLFWDYISKRYSKIVHLLMASPEIPVYMRKTNVSLIYDNDQIKVCPTEVQPDYLFKLTDEGLDYKFRFKANNEVIWINYRNQFIALSQSLPCTFILNNQLCVTNRVGHKAISAITKSGHIHVPKEKVDIYLDTFVKKILQTENAVCDGIKVERKSPTLEPRLTATTDAFGKAAVKAEFWYDNECFAVNSEPKHKVDLVKEDDKYTFVITKRNLDEEKRLADLLQENQLFANGEYLYLHDQHASLKEVLARPEMATNFAVKHDYELTTYADEKEDWFDVKMIVNVRGFKIPFAKFRRYIQKNESTYQLPDGTNFYIPEEWFSSYADFFEKVQIDGDEIHLHKRFAGLIAESCPVARNYIEHLSEEKQDTPASLNATLRSYQQKGFNYLISLYNNNYGGCLADDMGLGKTLQFISFFVHLYSGCKHEWDTNVTEQKWQYSTSEPTLFDQVLPAASTTETKPVCRKPASIVVVPTTVLFNWEKELQKFAPTLHYTTHYGSKRISNIGPHTFDAYNIVLTTYSILTRDAEKLQRYLFECAVLDESQNIKNPHSQNHTCAKMLNAHCHFVITGTPIENSLTDLWAQMSFACPGLLGSYHSFCEHYTATQPERLKALKKMVSAYILRRTKAEVCPELPELTKTDIWCDMDEGAKKIYETEKSAARNEMMRIGTKGNTLHILQQLTRLRQLACDPSILPEYSNTKSAKRQSVLELASELHQNKQKVLLFSAFVSQLNLIANDFKEQGIPYEMLTGESNSHERQQLVERFQNDNELTCLLISLKAGSTGINLTAANYVFLLSPWWNPFVEQQAIDRAYRIGQTNNVMVYNFITKDTVEEKILHLQEKKRQLANSIIDSANPLEHLSAKELEDLL